MQKDIIKIDMGLIPNYVRDDLAAATLEFINRNFMRNPKIIAIFYRKGEHGYD